MMPCYGQLLVSWLRLAIVLLWSELHHVVIMHHERTPSLPNMKISRGTISVVLLAALAVTLQHHGNSVLGMLQNWICNSSICMTRRGLKPTGIAIFEAQQQGFASVAHHLQVYSLLHCGSILENHGCIDSEPGICNDAQADRAFMTL